jgi:glycosyltransferase involved in cell wall biosynthesis
MSTDISVVICAHDEGRWPEIELALRSLEDQTLAPREVIVVVDNNQQLLDRLRDELSAPAIANTQAPGLGGARNSGIAASSGSIVAFLDDDAAPSPRWLARLAERYDDDVAGVGGSAEPRWSPARPAWFPAEFDWVVGCSYLGMPSEPAAVRNLFGCNMSFRRETLIDLGGFRLGYGCDETELCIRLHDRWPEKKLIYVPEADVSHYVPANRTRFRRFLSRCYYEGGSKAVVSKLVGRGKALSTEVLYTREVLPRGFARGLNDFARRRDVHGLARAGALVAGLASTTLGYLVGSLLFTRAATRRGFSPDAAPRSGLRRPLADRLGRHTSEDLPLVEVPSQTSLPTCTRAWCPG